MLAGKMEYMGDATWWDERFRSRENALMSPEAKLKLDLNILWKVTKFLIWHPGMVEMLFIWQR